MPELIQQRTMLRPGEGIVPPNQPTRQHQEYPKHMRHPGYAPAQIGEEITHPAGFKYHKGGVPGRYPPVLVHSEMDEEHHKSLGYQTVGTCSAESFARLVREAAPPIENHVAVQYPKWISGKLVHSALEEAAMTQQAVTGTSQPVAAPAVDTEVNTLLVPPKPLTADDEIAALETRLAEIKAKKQRAEELKAEIVAELAEQNGFESTVATGILPGDAERDAARAELFNPPGANVTCDVLVLGVDYSREQASASSTAAADKAAKQAATNAKIKATMVRKKAEKAAQPA